MDRKDKKPLISVIVPTYNRPAMLKEAIMSVLSQTYQNFEIIVVNDAGEDVKEIINSLNREDKIVYLQHVENKGLAAARNTGIKAAKGKYIAYLDDDDIYYPHHIETLVEFLEKTGFNVAYTDSYHVTQLWMENRYVTTSKENIFSYDFDRKKLLIQNYFPVINVMHRKDILDETGLFDESLYTHEDWDLWIRLSQHHDFYHIKEVTAEVRIREDNSNMTTRDSFPLLKTLQIIHKRYAHLISEAHILKEQEIFEENMKIRVEQQISAYRKTIQEQGAQIQEQGAQILRLEAKRKSFDKKLKQKQNEIDRLKAIEDSLIWRTVRRFLDLIDNTLFPRYSKRGRLYLKILKLIQLTPSNGTHNLYELWIKKNEPTIDELEEQKYVKFMYIPKTSIIVPTFNTPEQFLTDMIESVLNQTYSNWELCIADGGSKELYIKSIIDSYLEKDKRIKVKFLDRNKGITGNSNEALSLATGDFVVFLDHDDILAPFALFEVAQAINENPYVDFVYSDEDKISINGKERFDPHFKPDWSPDLLRSYNYITHLSVFKRELLNRIGSFREGFDGSQDYDLILRATEQARKIIHIPKILYHWRISPNSVASDITAKDYAIVSAQKALRDHLMRIGLEAKIENNITNFNSYRVTYKIKNNPKISLIIPNKDYVKLLKKCITSILTKTSYKNYEVIIVENNSSVKETFEYYRELSVIENINVIKWNNPFNYSAINNFAAKHAKGEILLFLNNDTEVINSDWMERLLEHVERRIIGAVGAKLYYPDGTIQHAGVIVGLGGVAGHSHLHYPKDSAGYMGRLQVIQNLSAVTGACLMMRKEIFKEVEGFDERFKLAFNDIDLCLKIREKGYLIIWTPYAELYHHESKTRGYEDTHEKQERFKSEIELFQQKWEQFLIKGDPYYNCNLTLARHDFSIRID